MLTMRMEETTSGELGEEESIGRLISRRERSKCIEEEESSKEEEAR